MGISYENNPPGFENSITLSQESHRIIKVLDDIKGSDGIEVIIRKLAFFQRFVEDIYAQPFPGEFHPRT